MKKAAVMLMMMFTLTACASDPNTYQQLHAYEDTLHEIEQGY